MKKPVPHTLSIIKLDRRSFLKNTSIGFTGIRLGMQIGCGPLIVTLTYPDYFICIY